MSDAPAIETLGLSKNYGDSVHALADLDLRVERSEVFGYLGPNGAGKSTTIRLLLGLIHPTAGRASLFGLDTQRDGVASRRPVGYLPGDLRLDDRLTGREQLDSLARLRGSVDEPFRQELCGASDGLRCGACRSVLALPPRHAAPQSRRQPERQPSKTK
jgi:ABC-2 type transport system ATP-binding protein